MKIKKLIAIYGLLFTPIAVAIDYSEDYFMDEMPIVLTASRMAQPKNEAPAAMTIIDRHMIEASGAIEIAELFRLVPGFQVAHANGPRTGHTMTVTYHGFSGERSSRTQVLIDGRSAYNVIDGSVPWFDLPITIDDIERIEIVRGPNGAAFGANAFLGTINIITKDPTEYTGTDYIATYGNKGVREATVQHYYQTGNLSLRLTAKRSMDTGFDDTKFAASPTDSTPKTYIGNDHKRTSLFNIQVEHTLNLKNKLDYSFSHVEGYRAQGADGGDNYTPIDPSDLPRNRNIISHQQHIRWSHTKNINEEMSVQFSHSYIKSSERIEKVFFKAGIPQYIVYFGSDATLDYSKKEQRYELEFQHNKRINDHYRLVWGTSARFVRAGGPTWFDRDDLIESRLYRIYSNQEWRINKKWLFNAGLMFEHSSISGFEYAPRLTLNFSPAPHHDLRIGLSKAIRLPNIYETYNNTILRTPNGTLVQNTKKGSRDLNSEKVRSIELAYLWNAPSINTEFDIRIFHDEISDYIKSIKNKDTDSVCDGPNATDAYCSYIINHPDRWINGLEFSLNYRPSPYSMLKISHSYLKAKGNSYDEFKKINDLLTNKTKDFDLEDSDHQNVPTHTTSLFLMHRFSNQWNISLTYNRVSTLRWLGNGDVIPPQDRLDIRIAKSFKLSGNNASIALTAQNIIGEYVEFVDANIMDTKVLLNFKLHLN